MKTIKDKVYNFRVRLGERNLYTNSPETEAQILAMERAEYKRYDTRNRVALFRLRKKLEKQAWLAEYSRNQA